MNTDRQQWTTTGSDRGTQVIQLAFQRVIVSSSKRDWHGEVIGKLNELTALPRGWDGYGGRPVRFDCANFALRMLEAIAPVDAPAPQIVPGSTGDLQLEWHLPNEDIELHVRGPNKVTAWQANVATGPGGQELQLTNDFAQIATWIRAMMEPAIADAAAA